MKYFTLSMVALLMAFTVLAGCSKDSSGGKDSGNDAEGFEFGKDDLEYTMYAHYDWYTMPTWGEDIASKAIKENMKVNVVPISSGGNASQKFNTMIVGDDLADVLWLDRGSDVERLRAADKLVAFDDYLDKYPNLKEWAGESTLNMLRSPDGKLYQFPNWYTSQPNGNAGYVVNEKIYKELGSPKLETTDDLYSYLQKVKENYPNVIPYEPGLGDGMDILYSAFGEDHPTTFLWERAVPQGDKFTSIFTDPVYRETMLYVSKLFREKLISQDALTQQDDQVKEKIVTGRFAVYGASSPTTNANLAHTLLREEDPDAGLKMVWPFHKAGLDKDKIWPGSFSQLGWNVSVITKNAKNPEGIFAFLDWMTGPEGQRNIFWGPEGLYWDGTKSIDGVDEAPVFTDAYVTDTKNRDELMETTNSLQWVGNTVYIDKSKMDFEMTLPEDQQNWATRYQATITWKTQYNGTPFANLSPLPDSEEGLISQRIEDIYEEAHAKAVHAKSDADVLKILDDAEAAAQAVGYEKLLAFKTERWQENVKRMEGK